MIRIFPQDLLFQSSVNNGVNHFQLPPHNGGPLFTVGTAGQQQDRPFPLGDGRPFLQAKPGGKIPLHPI